MAAKILSDGDVVLGKMIEVQNQNKKQQQNYSYIAIQVQDQNGDNERCLLFTQIQLADITKVGSKFLTDNLIAGRIYQFRIGKTNLFLVKILNFANQQIVIRLTKTKLKTAEKRAKNNPQDLTKKSWFRNIID